MKYEEIIDRSSQLAEGLPANGTPRPDVAITAEAVFPHAVRFVMRKQARTGRHLDNLVQAYPIEILSSRGDLPDGLMREYLDRAYIVNSPYASQVPFEDLQRYKGGPITPYAVRAAKIFYLGDVPYIIDQPSGCTAVAGSETISGNGSAAQVGDRFRLVDDTNGLIADAFITGITGLVSFTVGARALDDTTAPRAGTIYNGQDDEVLRSVEDLVTVEDSDVVTSENANWTSADVGRRLRVPDVVDAIILSVDPDNDQAALSGKALADGTALDADILYSALILEAIGIPPMPDSLCTDLDLVTEIGEDVITVIADVLKGALPLAALTDVQ